MEFVLAFAAGFLTLLNPCVLPVLPLAFASGFGPGRFGPLALSGGMSLSFTSLGMFVSVLGPGLGLSPESVAQAFSILMVAFGVVLLVPFLSARFALAAAGVANAAAQRFAVMDDKTIGSQFLGGILLGAIWSPCIGPTLGGAIALASQGAELTRAALVMLAFSAGVTLIILSAAYFARWLAVKGRPAVEIASRSAKPVMGAAFVIVGIATLLGVTDMAVGGLLDLMPAWLQDFTVSI